MSHFVGAGAAVVRRHKDTQGVNLTLALKYYKSVDANQDCRVRILLDRTVSDL